MHHQIHIKNNWLGSIFFSPGYSHTNGLLFSLHLGFEGITEIDTNPKGELVSFKVTPLPIVTEFSVFMLLQGITLGNSWLGGVSIKDYKIIWKIKMREIKKSNS